jgi:hypothetical protein
MGCFYAIFKLYAPDFLQLQVQDFVAATAAGSVFLYEFLIKLIKE